jgi:hypothetical protein
MGRGQQEILAVCRLPDPPGIPAQLLLEPPWPEDSEPDLAASQPSGLTNRRMRTGMSGGVRGGGATAPPTRFLLCGPIRHSVPARGTCTGSTCAAADPSHAACGTRRAVSAFLAASSRERICELRIASRRVFVRYSALTILPGRRCRGITSSTPPRQPGSSVRKGWRNGNRPVNARLRAGGQA